MLLRLPVMFAATIATIGLAHADDDQLKIQGVGISRDIDCQGKDVGIYGAENEIELTGRCGSITVHGSKHKVSFEQGQKLSVSGSDNVVNGGRTKDLVVSVAKNIVSTTLEAGDEPGQLKATGANNRISLVLVGPSRLDVGGVEQSVEWSKADGAPNPEVRSSGALNSIKRKK
ncbi:DUF3060 domain-containing protein [Rhodopseudomonas palustris]|uniref:DUF3060 domain-containing protein n=1 Tax=Rhodopseudomonas palustris TaxID=1076 RepID=UPI0020CBEC67|nr:DUF3060 domain-containing protein [Rhodopseudomonas palustris]MCP9627814.1 DUF3060 domain-containing protein [Rhodopseudomonas palustris]